MKKTTKPKRSITATSKPATSATRRRATARKAVAAAIDRRILSLDWKDLAARLGDTSRGAPGGIPESELKDYFGAEELERLQQLVGFSQTVRSRSAPLGNLIFLHGITGSDLGV